MAEYNGFSSLFDVLISCVRLKDQVQPEELGVVLLAAFAAVNVPPYGDLGPSPESGDLGM